MHFYHMLIQHNFLKLTRKRTQLTQIDLASLFQIGDFANVSRWEQGLRSPSVEILLGYHLLFDIPIDSLFDLQKQALKQALTPRIDDRVKYLKSLSKDAKVDARIGFLSEAFNRLTLSN